MLRFALHYAEMVLAMFAGMGVYFVIALAASAAAGSGYGEFRESAPGLVLFGMGLGMTAAMVIWMRYRGHSWPANRAMALSMVIPTALVLALLGSGLETNVDTLVALEHVVMFPAMLVAMLAYRGEFAHHEHAHA